MIFDLWPKLYFGSSRFDGGSPDLMEGMLRQHTRVRTRRPKLLLWFHFSVVNTVLFLKIHSLRSQIFFNYLSMLFRILLVILVESPE